MDERITVLEEKFAFLERQVEQLDEVVKELYRVADDLRRDVRAVQGYVEKMESRMLEELPEEKPT